MEKRDQHGMSDIRLLWQVLCYLQQKRIMKGSFLLTYVPRSHPKSLHRLQESAQELRRQC